MFAFIPNLPKEYNSQEHVIQLFKKTATVTDIVGPIQKHKHGSIHAIVKFASPVKLPMNITIDNDTTIKVKPYKSDEVMQLRRQVKKLKKSNRYLMRCAGYMCGSCLNTENLQYDSQNPDFAYCKPCWDWYNNWAYYESKFSELICEINRLWSSDDPHRDLKIEEKNEQIIELRDLQCGHFAH